MALFAGLVGLLVVACGNDSAEPPTAPGPRAAPDPPAGARAAGASEPDPPVEAPPSAWPDRVEDLSLTLAGLTTESACEEDLRARIPVELSEAIADIGYAAIIHDVCRGLFAVRDHSAEGCDELGVSSLRGGCRRRLAIFARDPNACPDDGVVGGREPMCLAWAARSTLACRGVATGDAPRCAAVLANDAARCQRADRQERIRCVSEVRRYGSTVAAAPPDRPADDDDGSDERVFRIEVTPIHGGRPAGDTVIIDRDVLARGVYLEAKACRYEARLADPLGEVARAVSLARDPWADLRLTLPVAADDSLVVPFGPSANLSLLIPGRGEASTLLGDDGTVTLSGYRPTRGAAFTGTLEGRVRLAQSEMQVRGTFTTFVRDVDPIVGCGEPAAP